jgi:phosphoglucosamine mutase
VDGDHVLGILALELKEQGRLPSNTVVATDMSNTGLEHYLRDHGIAMIRTKVGDRYVMDKLRQGDYLLGGEQAGHVILLDGESTCGDGIYVGLLIAALVSRNKRSGGPTLHDLATRIPRYPQVIASAQLATTTDLAKVKGLDGLKQQALAAFGGKGRVNMRFSGTEPNLLRVMVEGGPANTIHETTAWAKTLCAPVAEATKTASPTIDMVDCATGAPL